MGSVGTERITLNEKTLWRGGPGTGPGAQKGTPEGARHYWDMNKESAHLLPEIREALAAGDNAKAARLTQQNFNSNVPYEATGEEEFRFGSFTTLGELCVETGIAPESAGNYRRALSVDSALASVTFTAGGVGYERRAFVSYPDNVLAVRFKADRGGMQNLKFVYEPSPVAEGRFETWNGEKYFKLNQTLAGGNDVTTGDNVSDVDLYVKVEGWGLNTLASQSYMSKKLDESWKTTDVYTGWNKSDDWRSFWGVAHTYGAYDQSKFTYKTPKEIYGNGQAFSEDLKNNTEYCYENTNAPVNIFTAVTDGPFTLSGAKVGVENARVTHVVLRTKIYQKNSDGSFATLDDLVQYRGILYTGDSFKALVLNSLKAAGTLNFWRYTGSSTDPATDVVTTNWQSITANDVEMVKNTDADHKLGEIKVVAKALAEGDKIYQRTVVKEEGKDVVKYVDITSAYKNTLDGLLDAVYSNYNPVGTDSADAIYYIPIEHNATALVQGTPTEAKEAFYGVVRNHWYKLTVNSFKKVGHLVFDPENDTTQIIPDKPEDPLYYVGAKINILSWKVINQSINDL